MSQFITVPVLWNNENSFQNNSLTSIDATSIWVATVLKPSKPYPLQGIPSGYTTTQQVKDPNWGTLYINMPLSAYQALIQAASGSNSPQVKTNFYTISGSPSTITDSTLSGATLILIWKNGTVLAATDYSISGSTVTFTSPLADSDQVGIIYYTS